MLFFIPIYNKIKLYSLTINMAIIVHNDGFHTTTTDNTYNLQDSNHIKSPFYMLEYYNQY